MKTKQLVFWLPVLTLAFALLTGCADFNRNWTRTSQTLHEGKYMVAGKVTNMQATPIDQTKVFLLKTFFKDPMGRDNTTLDDQDTDHLVVTTDPSGEFLISFELLSADDIWLYIDASDQGYKPRFVNLNKRLGDSLFHYPGNSPVSVHVVLEKEIRQDLM